MPGRAVLERGSYLVLFICFFDVFAELCGTYAGISGEKTMGYDIENPENDVFEDGFEEADMQDFYDNVAKRFCPECGEAFKRNPKGRPKKFCSEKCRRTWHRKHIHPENWKSTRKLICPVCGRMFLAVRDEECKRKYCSRSCANRARAGKGKADETLL